MLMRGKITIALLLPIVVFAVLRLFGGNNGGMEPERIVVSEPANLSVPEFVMRHLPDGAEELQPLPVFVSSDSNATIGVQLFGELALPEGEKEIPGPLRVEYTFDAELMRSVRATLLRARVRLGHVIVMDPKTGRLIAYVSTDEERFPPTRTYPAASLIKVVTAAAALHHAPEVADRPCRYRGSPYRLTRSRLNPPKRGNEVSFRRALATSNNQCFAQLAVRELGRENLLGAIRRFGFLDAAAPGHAAGVVEAGEDPYELGRLGCGLSGCQITPLHAVSLAATLATGEQVPPVWIERVTDGLGRELSLPPPPPSRVVLSLPPPPPSRVVLTPELAAELRSMLVETTQSGTARRAFRGLRGRPLLGPVKVAGKTGSLSGKNPKGRYEWFAGVAPAAEPTIAIAVLVVQGDLWWRSASQIAAEVLRTVFCSRGVCRSEAGAQWMPVR